MRTSEAKALAFRYVAGLIAQGLKETGPKANLYDVLDRNVGKDGALHVRMVLVELGAQLEQQAKVQDALSDMSDPANRALVLGDPIDAARAARAKRQEAKAKADKRERAQAKAKGK